MKLSLYKNNPKNPKNVTHKKETKKGNTKIVFFQFNTFKVSNGMKLYSMKMLRVVFFKKIGSFLNFVDTIILILVN